MHKANRQTQSKSTNLFRQSIKPAQTPPDLLTLASFLQLCFGLQQLLVRHLLQLECSKVAHFRSSGLAKMSLNCSLITKMVQAGPGT